LPIENRANISLGKPRIKRGNGSRVVDFILKFYCDVGFFTSFKNLDVDLEDKLRPDSCTGSNSSKSFELLKMPSGKSGTSTGNGNGSGSGHTSGDDLVSIFLTFETLDF